MAQPAQVCQAYECTSLYYYPRNRPPPLRSQTSSLPANLQSQGGNGLSTAPFEKQCFRNLPFVHAVPHSILFHLALCPGEADLGGLNQWSPLPSGSCLGSNNGKPQTEGASNGKEGGDQGFNLFSPLPLPCWATVGWLGPSTKSHSSCQVGLSIQYCLRVQVTALSPLSSGLGEVTALSYYRPQQTALSLWSPHIFVNSSFMKLFSNH